MARLLAPGRGIRPRSYREPALAELGHPDVTTDDTAFRAIRRAMPFLRSCREPALAELGHPDVTTEGIATPCMHLDSREAHPVLARQLRVRLYKALRSRTRVTENAHALITHRLE